MKYIFTCLILLLSFFSCNNKGKEYVEESDNHSLTISQKTDGTPINPKAIDFNSFTSIDNTHWIRFELGDENYPSSSGSFESSRNEKGYTWNLLFINTETGEKYLLRDRPYMRILRHETPSLSSSSESVEIVEKPTITPDFTIYSIIEEDANLDNTFNRYDPTFLYTSDSLGKNFKKISPQGYHVSKYDYNMETQEIVMMLHTYKSQENKVQYSEQTYPYIYFKNRPLESIFLLSPEETNELKGFRPE